MNNSSGGSSGRHDFEAIARRIERKRAMASQDLAVESFPLAGGVVAYSGPGGYATRACGLGEVTREDVARMVEFFESRGEEAMLEISAYAPPTLLAYAAEAGFVVKNFILVLVQALNAPGGAPAPIAAPNEVRIERVDKSDREGLRVFIEINERGFAPEGQAPSPAALALTAKSMQFERTEPFAARSKETGEIVGVGGLDHVDNLGTLYGATTLPGWRGKGVQAALMRARLARAHELGGDLACVMTSPGAERNALRQGFMPAYTRVALRKPR